MRIVKAFVKRAMTHHRQGTEKNIFIFSTARSGTTWLTELLATQDRFKIVNEPFNLRRPEVREHSGFVAWEEILGPHHQQLMRTYLQTFISGADRDLRYSRPTPFSDQWHFSTTRVIFKLLFAGEDCIDWLRSQFDAHVILLLRHPIPVSLSREELPRLESFLKPPYSDHFTREQLALAESIVERGDRMEMAVLDWCLQNSVRLKAAGPEWLVLGYEQLVLEPEVVIPAIANRLNFARPQDMMDRIFVPSASTTKSDDESKRLLHDQASLRANRKRFVDRWRSSVDEKREAELLAVLEAFEIDFYEIGHSLPRSAFLIKP